MFGQNFLMLIDPTLRNLKNDKEEQKSWIRDQYIHEVLQWFKNNDIEFISSIPSCDFDDDHKNLFIKKSQGSFYSRIMNQISMIFSRIGSDGGLFILIGKKNR